MIVGIPALDSEFSEQKFFYLTSLNLITLTFINFKIKKGVKVVKL